MPLSLDNGSEVLPIPDNLIWADEFDWEPVAQRTDYTLSGALLIEEAVRLAGRPITYRGGARWVRMTREDLLALQGFLAPADAVFTLTHYDEREFTVIPRRIDGPPLIVTPWPEIADSGVADPGDDAYYIIEELRLIEVPT